MILIKKGLLCCFLALAILSLAGCANTNFFGATLEVFRNPSNAPTLIKEMVISSREREKEEKDHKAFVLANSPKVMNIIKEAILPFPLDERFSSQVRHREFLRPERSIAIDTLNLRANISDWPDIDTDPSAGSQYPHVSAMYLRVFLTNAGEDIMLTFSYNRKTWELRSVSVKYGRSGPESAKPDVTLFTQAYVKDLKPFRRFRHYALSQEERELLKRIGNYALLQVIKFDTEP